MAISSGSSKADDAVAADAGASRKLEAFEKAVHEFNKDQSLEAMLESALPEAAKAIGVEMLVVYLLDPDGRSLLPAFQMGIDNGRLAPVAVASGDNMVAWTYDRGIDLFNHESRLLGAKGGAKLESVPDKACCLPLISHGAPVGILACAKAGEDAVSAKDKAFIEDIAGLVSLAVGSGIPNSDILQRERAERSLQFAHMLQRSFTPASLPQANGWRVDCHRISALEMGGDFHDAIALPNGKLAAIIGQTSGQGVDAGLNIAWIVAELRRILAGGVSLPDTLKVFNESLLGRMRRGVLVSLAVASIDAGGKSCSICRAGAVDVFQADSKGHLEPIGEDSSPIGAFSGQTFFMDNIAIGQGGALILGTPGISPFLAEAGKLASFEELMQRTGNRPQSPAAALIEEARNWCGPALLNDDITILSLELQS